MKRIIITGLLSISSFAVIAQRYNAQADFSDTKNPNGVWEYGMGTVGGDFTAYTAHSGKSNAKWWATNDWQGVYKNYGPEDVTMSDGFILKPNALVMHPGNGKAHLSKVVFTAPADGTYLISATWTSIDKQAKKSWTWVCTNANSVKDGTVYAFTPAGWKEIFTKGIEGPGGTTKYIKRIGLLAGEKISFEIGNGGDGYKDDALEAVIEIQNMARQ